MAWRARATGRSAGAIALLLACALGADRVEGGIVVAPTASELDAPATISVANFSSLNASIADGVVIQVTENIVFAKNITIPTGTDVTISGATGGEVLSGDHTTRHFYVQGILRLARITLRDGYTSGDWPDGGVSRSAPPPRALSSRDDSESALWRRVELFISMAAGRSPAAQ